MLLLISISVGGVIAYFLIKIFKGTEPLPKPMYDKGDILRASPPIRPIKYPGLSSPYVKSKSEDKPKKHEETYTGEYDHIIIPPMIDDTPSHHYGHSSSHDTGGGGDFSGGGSSDSWGGSDSSSSDSSSSDSGSSSSD